MAKTSEDLQRGPLIAYGEAQMLPGYVLLKNQTLRSFVQTTVFMLTDLVSLMLALAVGFTVRIYVLPSLLSSSYSPHVPAQFYDNIWWILAINVFCIFYDGLYFKRMSFWREAERLVMAVTLAFLITFSLITLAKLGGEVSRTILIISYIIALFIVPTGRYLMKRAVYRSGRWSEPVLIMGAGITGNKVAGDLASEWYTGYRILGFLDDDPVKATSGIEIKKQKYKVIGSFADAETIIEKYNVQTVIIAAPSMPGEKLVALTNQIKSVTHSVLVIPDLVGISVSGGQVDYLSNDRLVAYRTHNNLAIPLNRLAKRLFDMTLGTIICLICLPIMLIIAAIIRLDSPGQAIYSGKRLGRLGKEFKCYKFRTMYLDNDVILESYLQQNPQAAKEWKKFAKLRGNDPRVTRVGKWLRRTSLDELPQIINVLKGEMSLVGARPYLTREKQDMGHYMETILMASPGITGLWQVSGRNDIDFQGRLELEQWYVQNWSLWNDISLLFRTVNVVLGRNGAY